MFRIYYTGGLRRTSMSSPSWIFKLLVSAQRLLLFVPEVCQPQRPWTKTRTSTAFFRTETRASNVQDGRGVDVLRGSAPQMWFDNIISLFLPNLEISWPIHICKLQRSFCTTQEFDQDFTNQMTSNRVRNHDKNFDETKKIIWSQFDKVEHNKNSILKLVHDFSRDYEPFYQLQIRILFKFNSRRNNWRKKSCVKIIYWWRISSEMDKQLRKLAQIGSMTFDLCSWGH